MRARSPVAGHRAVVGGAEVDIAAGDRCRVRAKPGALARCLVTSTASCGATTSARGRYGSMEPALTSMIAVVGTLLGASLTYLFQRRAQERANAETRSEKRREQFTGAVAAFASTTTTLRRAEIDRGKKRLEGVPGSAREAARQETYRLRAEASSAYYLVRLLSDPDQDVDLVREAKTVIDLSRLITARPMSEAELQERSTAATAALETFIDAANHRLRYSRTPAVNG